MSTHPPIAARDLSKILASAAFYGLRWESPFTPCTGITAVFRQERQHFAGRGVYLAPWFPRMAAARKALADGKVVPVTEVSFDVVVQGRRVPVAVLVSTDALAPILYVSLPGDEQAFAGVQTPYDTAFVKRDSLLFALAVDQLLAHCEPRGRSIPAFIWAADWQCVPAMARLHRDRVTCLHLHNLYDEYLGDEARALGYDYTHFFEGRSVLTAGFEAADVVATVSRGFADGARRELLHTAIFAPHLQGQAHRLEAVENANFADLDAGALKLAAELDQDLPKGLKALTAAKQAARKKLPAEIAGRVAGRTLIVSMGRAATQKLHCVVVEAATRLLGGEAGANAFFVFATTDGDRDDQVRQDVIAGLAARHPEAVAAYTGRISFFSELMQAADLNVMASLWEPFGGAFEGTVLPVGRAVDGLASQIRPYQPSALVRDVAPHDPAAPACGWLFREALQGSAASDLSALLTSAVPTIRNATYAAMIDACTEALTSAVKVHQQQPLVFAELVRNALALQRTRSWSSYDRMLDLAADAARNRGL